ncbi:MSHA biogenesis protein MshK [Janthinobacterium sp. 17J80-10]|uniref:MSHA biogenesis protein MshK n=1 Tax=Janthinobacterium sp. 17J80-10 TaxID=2497863 RepID=UPI0019D709C9|nr:MSHA biogenesis protein MshK [Janthinobacterium sp. 17J80-10]
MVESVNKAGKSRLLFCIVMMLINASPVMATDNLPDPTRPPAAFAAGEAGSVVASGPVLQSVLIASGRRVAVISGQTVQVGDKIGDLRVAKIDEGKVVLGNGKDVQTLKLFPGIEKRLNAAGATGKTPGKRE